MHWLIPSDIKTPEGVKGYILGLFMGVMGTLFIGVILGAFQ